MTNLSSLFLRYLSCERSYDIGKNVHEHGMNLLQAYLVVAVQNVNLTHILRIFFGDFDEWHSL